MSAVAVRHRANQAVTVGEASEPRQQLADTHAGDVGGDRPVWAADVLRSVGLEVPAIVMASAAILDDKDAGSLRAAPYRAGDWSPGVQQFGQTEAERSDAAHLEQSSTGPQVHAFSPLGETRPD